MNQGELFGAAELGATAAAVTRQNTRARIVDYRQGRPVRKVRAPAFDGNTYVELRDGGRLKGQLAKVFQFCRDGQWYTLQSIAGALGGGASTQAVSARLRDLRKAKYGAHDVDRRHVKGGLFDYRLRLNPDTLSVAERAGQGGNPDARPG